MFEESLHQGEMLAATHGDARSEGASIEEAAEPTAAVEQHDNPQVVGAMPPAEAMGQPPTESVEDGREPQAEKAVEPLWAVPEQVPPAEALSAEPFETALRVPPLAGQRRGRRLVKPAEKSQKEPLTPEQRLLILDTWQRSGLPAGDFATLVGVSKHTLFKWKQKFQEQGPAGLMDQPRGGPKGSRLPELTKRTILMLKQSHAEWGCQRISDMLVRGPGLPASAAAVAKVLHEAGYEMEEVPTHPHPDKVRRFERAAANQLWQTDLFTFMLKRQNRRVYLVAFMDDHSRFITGYGLYASQSTALVLEAVRAAMTAYGTPVEMLTDNGSQYVTWRGKSLFAREMEKRGIKHTVARPRHPQTLGKIERFWGTLWRECIEAAVFLDLEDARRRIGHFIDHYNFQRPHQGIEGLVPADRFFGAASHMHQELQKRVAENALELARNGVPKPPFYVTGRIGDRAFSMHAEGERVILKREGEERQEVDLSSPQGVEVPLLATAGDGTASELPLPVCPDGSPQGDLPPEYLAEMESPGDSPLDAGLDRLQTLGDDRPTPGQAEQGGTP